MTRTLVVLCLTLSVAVISSGCAGGRDDAAPEGTPPTVPEPPEPYLKKPPPALPEAEQARMAGYTDELESTFNNARDICRYDGIAKIAKELRAPADSPQAVARAYSHLAKPGDHRNASYSGCLRGLITVGGVGPEEDR